MANRLFKQFLYSLERQPVVLNAVVTVTGEGPNTITTDVKGLEVAVSDTGEWTITLEDKYQALLNANITVQAATEADLTTQIKSEDVDGAKTIVFSTLAEATPTALSTGDKIYITLLLRNSSL